MEREELLALFGRVLLSLIFLAAAFGKITGFEDTTKYMESYGIPWPSLFCALAALLEGLGGVALILGFRARAAAGALFIFLAMVTPIFHRGRDQRIHLLKNLAIMGGLLEVAARGPGDLSLDGGAEPHEF